MKPRLRLASIADAADIAALVNRAYRPVGGAEGWTHESALIAGPRVSEAQVRSLFGAQSSLLLLCHDQKILACVHVRLDRNHAAIGMLATDPRHQNLGLGKQMLEDAEGYVQECWGMSHARMSVLSARPELMAFYQRRGYVCTGEFENYPVSAGVGVPRVEGLQVEVMSKFLGRESRGADSLGCLPPMGLQF